MPENTKRYRFFGIELRIFFWLVALLFILVAVAGFRNSIWLSVLFFLIFIFIASFAILNLFIALIVDSLAAEQQAIIEEGLDEIEEELEGELMTAEKGRVAVLSAIQDMRSEIAALRAVVESQRK